MSEKNISKDLVHLVKVSDDGYVCISTSNLNNAIEEKPYKLTLCREFKYYSDVTKPVSYSEEIIGDIASLKGMNVNICDKCYRRVLEEKE